MHPQPLHRYILKVRYARCHCVIEQVNRQSVSPSVRHPVYPLLHCWPVFANFVRLSVYSNVTTTTSLSVSLVGLSTECLSVCLPARFSLVYIFIKRKRKKTAFDVRAAVALVLLFEPDDSALGCWAAVQSVGAHQRWQALSVVLWMKQAEAQWAYAWVFSLSHSPTLCIYFELF